MQPETRTIQSRSWLILLALITLAGLGLRLLAWHWHEFYPLGGDEREYLEQALALLRGEGYHELKFMRPPLYAVFLAAGVWLVDGSTQGLRLIQAVLSAATIPLIYGLTWELLRGSGVGVARGAALAAALLAALSYTLALNATELLTETSFLFGLTLVFWLLLLAARRRSARIAFAAGLALGVLCLLRSVALPLLALGAGWLWLQRRQIVDPAPGLAQNTGTSNRHMALLFIAGALLCILPWTARNVARYDSFILIDTTGQENLWLDNDPAGREAVKRQLYAMGEDRGGRARLATRMGLRAIAADPARFAAKSWRELQAFFALEQVDDMRARPAIWVRPAEVWLRLLFGDGVWLVVLTAGLAGLAFGPWRGMRAVLGLWIAYVILTAAIYHVELRYRLPLYPALLPAAGWAISNFNVQGLRFRWAQWRAALAAALVAAAVALTLLHAPYPSLAWQLGRKHLHLARADAALAAGDPASAHNEALAALQLDERSALARVALARAALQQGREAEAERQLRQAIDALPAHPYAHLLLGDLLRRRGDEEAARRELAYETAALEDLQRWAWQRFVTAPPSELDIGGGLDLGWLTGFHPAEDGARWTTGRALLRLGAPAGRRSLILRLRSPRPAGAPEARVSVLVDGREQAQVIAGPEWHDLEVPLPAGAGGELLVEIRSSVFRPHDYDRASPDGRRLGVELDEVRVVSLNWGEK
ncbi:MAG: hypothetical protein KatS3mg057_1689 [Herpetosiphonaceae bacterium]|nr:MAG: hypothetical protein KatS3mg057_1689 [Herpetosiphonaceae bacterium]